MKGVLQKMWAWQNINRDLFSHFLPEETFTSFPPQRKSESVTVLHMHYIPPTVNSWMDQLNKLLSYLKVPIFWNDFSVALNNFKVRKRLVKNSYLQNEKVKKSCLGRRHWSSHRPLPSLGEVRLHPLTCVPLGQGTPTLPETRERWTRGPEPSVTSTTSLDCHNLCEALLCSPSRRSISFSTLPTPCLELTQSRAHPQC